VSLSRRVSGYVLDDQDGRLVFFRDDDADHVQRPTRAERDRVADAPFVTVLLIDGGSAGVPSARSSLKVKVIRSLLVLGPDARRAYRAEAVERRRSCVGIELKGGAVRAVDDRLRRVVLVDRQIRLPAALAGALFAAALDARQTFRLVWCHRCQPRRIPGSNGGSTESRIWPVSHV
jgi:hypothetical protein